MSATVNERLADAATDHAIDLQHYGTNVVHRMVALLNRADPSIFSALTDALERLPPESFTVQRLEMLLGSVRELNARVYAQINAATEPELRQLSDYELGYQKQLFEAAIPAEITAQLSIASVSADAVYAASMARPFQGVLLREALDGVAADRAKIIRDQIRIGYVANEPVAKIVQRIRGTRAKNYADGYLEKPRAHIESIVRTAVSHTAGVARDQFYKANTDLIVGRTWLSVIDGRTSQPCILRDLKQYTNDTPPRPVGHSYAWDAGPGALHWCCRSTSVPITPSFRSLGIPIDNLSPSTRASMDGQIPAKTTYAEWLGKQSAARQDQILGPTRGKLLRDGGLTVDKFATNRGVWLDLDQLRAKDAAAFEKAGV